MITMDPILNVKPSSPYHFVGSVKRTAVEQKETGIGSMISGGLETGVNIAGKGLNIFKQVAVSFGGLGSLILGGIMKTFFKDHTAADAGSLVLMIVGGFLGLFGLYDLSKVFKSQNKQLEKNVEHVHEKVSERLGAECNAAEKALVSSDPTLKRAKPETRKSQK